VTQAASGDDDGCETMDLNTNPENCGTLGRTCSTSNVATLSCTGGVCTSTCQTGWLNVTQPASSDDDGCETADTTVNVDNCGAAGRACSSANVDTRTCASGLCTSTCPSGYANLNLPAAPAADDGCEQPYVTCTFDGPPFVVEPLSSYTESGFTVVATAGSWERTGRIEFLSQPGVPTTAEISVTAGGSAFSFVSVDLYSSVTTIPYVFTGLMGSTTVFSVTGTVPNTFGATVTVVNPRRGDLIDTLFIELTNSAPFENPMALDNLRLWR
jgi:hypothetical protein